MPDYLPLSDAELVAWMTNFVTYAAANLAALGLTPADMSPVSGTQGNFAATFNANIAARNAAKNAAQAKDVARAGLETQVCIVVHKLQGSTSVTNAQRQSLGITVRSAARTPVGVPASRPMLSVDTSQLLRHTIAFSDETTPASKAKPDGVMGCEIWVKIGGAAPTAPAECTFLGLDTRTPYTTKFDGADAGKTAHYLGRWSNTKDKGGPWSETIGG